jgi:hypothetical protein
MYRIIFFVVSQIVNENAVGKTNTLFIFLGISVVLTRHISLLMRFKPGYCTSLFFKEVSYMGILFSWFIVSLGFMGISFSKYEQVHWIAEYFLSIKIANSLLLSTYVIYCTRCMYIENPLYRLSTKFNANKLNDGFFHMAYEAFLWVILFTHATAYFDSNPDLLRIVILYAFGIISNLFFWCYEVNTITQYRIHRVYLRNLTLLRHIIKQQLYRKEKISYFLCIMFLIIMLIFNIILKLLLLRR